MRNANSSPYKSIQLLFTWNFTTSSKQDSKRTHHNHYLFQCLYAPGVCAWETLAGHFSLNVSLFTTHSTLRVINNKEISRKRGGIGYYL